MKGQKWNGRGIEYYHNGKLKFEVEYLKALKWNGIMYAMDGNIILEIKNGNGKGISFL